MRERTSHINVRVTEKEKSIMERNAKKCGLSLSEFLRKLAFGYVPKAQPPEELLKIRSLLYSVHDRFRAMGKDEDAKEIITFVRQIENEYINPERMR